MSHVGFWAAGPEGNLRPVPTGMQAPADAGPSAQTVAEEPADRSCEGVGGRWQAREDTLSGELGWEGRGRDREPKPPSPGRASCVTVGASGPHQQLPRAAWELREVDMEQKQH